MRHWLVLIVIMLFVSSCGALKTEVLLSPIPTENISAEISEESLIATEQFMAGIVKTDAALTMAAQPTFTPMPTLTSTLANLPTLTPIANSTPEEVGAFFDVAPDVLGSQYKMENACYFDTQSGWERYEIYAGAVSNSGDEYSAQGAVVIRHFRMVQQGGKAQVELVDTKELLTLKKLGPLHLPTFGKCGGDWILLTTPLNFGWFLEPGGAEFYQYEGIVPFARLQVGDQTQLARVGSYCWKGGCGDGPVIPTSSTPLRIQSSRFARLYLPLVEPPDALALTAMLVSSPGILQGDPSYDYMGEDNASWSYEKPGRNVMELGIFPLRREQDIKLSLEPGYYALTVLAVWHDYGDVKYGFLVEVQE
jgi:hypothetical protein